MPTDLHFPFQYDSTGDAATVSGTEFYEQHALLLAAAALSETYGSALTANDLTEIRSQLQNQYTASPYFATPTRVEITDVQGTRVDISVDLGDGEQFTIPVDVQDITV